MEAETITKARNTNFINGLSGKVAGVQIRQSNTLGGSTNVTIRGTKSLFGNNQPLFVVDGVPISNANTNTSDQQTGRGGYDYGNAAADINPDDIASTTVLKGAAATALYGERASNGVILITTKKGRKGLGVTINTGATVGRIDKSTFIKYQKEYGGGYGAYYEDASGRFLSRDVNGDGIDDLVVPTSEDASYGGRFDPNLMVYQWDAFDPESPNFGKAKPWVAAKNGPESIFQNALSLNNSILIDGGSDRGFFKLGYSSIRDGGILPNSQVNKNIVNLSASFNITPKLTTSGSINYTRVDGRGRYGTGYGSSNLMTNFRQWWQTNVDIKDQKAAFERTGRNLTWNYTDPDERTAIYWDNPYWTREVNFSSDSRNRYFGNVAATYKVTDWFDILGRITLDTYDEIQEERQAITSTSASESPFYKRYNRTSLEANYDLIGNFNKQITDQISFKGLIGSNIRRQEFNSIRSSTSGGLAVPNLFSLDNSLLPLIPPTESQVRIGVDGIFASATLGYRDLLYLDLTARRDKNTALPSKNNTYYYPSAALGFVFSELMKDTPWLSYGKARINYANVGAGPQTYVVFDQYVKPTPFPANNTYVPLFSVNSIKNNPDLKPERTRGIEAGVEMAFLQSRVGFDLTVYEQNTVDQIIPANVSVATGYNQRYINTGEVRNRGVELTAFVTPVKTNNFSWTVNANWTRNQNEVISLEGGVDNILIASYQGGISTNATVGQPFGTLRGSDYIYKDGQRVVGDDGYYLQTATSNNVIGNPNPKWNGGLANTLNYKGLQLYFLVDVRKGGSVFSLDRYYGLATGLTPETAGLNDLGNPSRNDLDQGGGVILPGVKEDGSRNDIRVDNSEYGLYGYVHNPTAGFVYDASFVKLREVALTYSLPSSLVNKVSALKGIDLSLVGRNLWIIHKNLPDADPEDALSSGNLGQGYSSGAYPAVRTIGGNIRFSF
ncbi:SusC/RagA family TonB-linked outer membrane protein [Hymenobacter coalescens]